MHLIASSFDDIVRFQIPVWDKVLRTVVVYALIYLLIRLAKRDAAQLTASDFVVVLLLSNVVQNAIIGPDNSLLGGAVGAVTLIVVNEMVARWEWARKMARADRSQQEEKERKPSPEPTGMISSLWAARTDPVLLIDDGEVQEWALKGSASRSWTCSPSSGDRAWGTRADDVEWAEIRTGGAIDYKLRPEAESATKQDIHELLQIAELLRRSVDDSRVRLGGRRTGSILGRWKPAGAERSSSSTETAWPPWSSRSPASRTTSWTGHLQASGRRGWSCITLPTPKPARTCACGSCSRKPTPCSRATTKPSGRACCITIARSTVRSPCSRPFVTQRASSSTN